MRSTVLSVSHAENVAPDTQECRERGLVAAATLGESHLHVSTLGPGDVLGLGAFHRRPAHDAVPLWARHVGGRAVASGRGFVVVTLALPHRAALVDDDRRALAPEQVMNRCIRGLLVALRELGVDPVYPGLDEITHRQRRLGTLGFVEFGDPTLFQVVLAASGSFAVGPHLLDRADPDGVVPTRLLGEGDTTSLLAIGGPSLEAEVGPAAFAVRLGAAYAKTFGIEAVPLDDEVTTVLADAYRDEPSLLEPPTAEGRSARAGGLLGTVEAWTAVDHGRIERVVLAGDFIAPATAPSALAHALRGRPVDGEAIEAAVHDFLDRDRNYLLGLRPPELADLLARSAGVDS